MASRKEGKTDESRRSFLRLSAAGLGLSLISFAVVDRNKVRALLQPVPLEQLLGAPSSSESLEEKARRKEAEVKRWCRREAERICSEKGESSPECVEARSRCGQVRVKATEAQEGKRYAMALDLNKCIGCRRCVYACVMENNMGRNLGIEWIRVLETDREGFQELAGVTEDYGGEAPRRDKVYIPVACMHCEDPPCVQVCPVRATWKEPDGIVVVDYDRCIGCRYCAVACPYGARHFNWTKPELSPVELNPNMHVLGNIPRQPHVMEKCTWCIQRVRDGGVPACVEACPVGARVFGDLNDPESPIRRIIEEYGVFVLKPSAGTRPRFFYFFGPAQVPRRGEE